MRASDPKPIDSVLASVLHELGLGARIRQFRVFEVWNSAVGEQIARVATPDRIERGKLIVRVSKAPWRNELIFLKKDIMIKLNRVLGEEIVKEIIFR